MIVVDKTDLRGLERLLKKMERDAIPYATRAALNDTAYTARKYAVRQARINYILKNKWTEKSIRFEKTRSLTIRSQASLVGSTEKYMKDQEMGGINIMSGAVGVPIPTGYAAGQDGQVPRTRVRTFRNSMPEIKLNKPKLRRMSRRQRNLVLIKDTAGNRTGKGRVVFLDFGKRKGMFRVIGSKKSPKIKMLYDMSQEAIPVRPDPWLRPAVGRVEKVMPVLYARAFAYQLGRLKALRG